MAAPSLATGIFGGNSGSTPALSYKSAIEEKSMLAPWKVLVVDDDEDVHVITHMVLRTINYRSRKLQIIDAYSAAEARSLLVANPDTALILLDVVMETPDAGLKLVQAIRGDLAMDLVRIILRTGQPGFAPETEVMQQYDINDYQNKTELTLNRLKTIIIAGIRSFDSLLSVDKLRRNLELTVKERTRDLEESNTIKDTMFSIIAHDLRGPIGNLKGFLDILIKQRDPVESDENSEYLHILQSNASATLFLLDNLLFWARANKQLIETEMAETDMEPVAQEVIELLGGQAWAKKIDLGLEKTGSSIGWFDRNMISLVLRNLVSNAIKFTREEGQIRIKLTGSIESIDVMVTDNGVGIEKERIPELVAKGLKKSTFGTQAEKGSGLGIMLCLEFLRMHGSWLEIKSVLNQGSSFSFKLRRKMS